MSLFSRVESGTSSHKSRFHKSISFRKKYDCRFGDMIPVLAKFVLPGDVWRIGGNALVRFHPMTTPTLTRNSMKVRYFFVPLRLVEPDTELILTGSKDGHVYNSTLPTFDNIFDEGDKVRHPTCFTVGKYSLWDYMGIQVGDYESFKDDACLPAAYWTKGFERIRWDYYDDENIGPCHQTYADFDAYVSEALSQGGNTSVPDVQLRKDYFTSALPWQLKGTAPVLEVTGKATFTPDYTSEMFDVASGTVTPNIQTAGSLSDSIFEVASGKDLLNEKVEDLLNQQQKINITGLGFNADELRTMMAQTRIFERLARTGSRYTEYLHANFGTAPADGTLQRAQYLGGWSMPIVTTEVVQTAGDSATSTPVGTMRGHGISNGGSRISTFHAKEFGLLFGIAHIIPDTEYTQGCPKEFSYKSRFDFFNPSFQHLSEQEVRKGELFIGSDGENDNTFGFQAYANELRTSVDMTVGDLRDTLANWTQSLNFGTTRPELNASFIRSSSHRANYNQCFAVSGTSARPCIVDFYNDLDVYRPMIRYSTPGLVDHL